MIRGMPERLQKLRIQRGYSQKQIADMIGVSSSVMSGYETGERTPSAVVLIALASAYKCSADYLLGIDSKNEISIDTKGLSENQIQAVRNLIAAFSEEK